MLSNVFCRIYSPVTAHPTVDLKAVEGLRHSLAHRVWLQAIVWQPQFEEHTPGLTLVILF